MSAKSYAFNVGNVACMVLLDGANLMGAEGVMKRFPNGSEAEYRQAYADVGMSLDEAVSCFNILVVKIGSEVVLVDTGLGRKPNGGYLPESMQLAGIKPEAITLVVITHSHGDHILGLLGEDNQPIFPNARYVMSKAEMEVWRSRIEASATDQRPILDMLEANNLRLIEGNEQIIPGLTAVPIPGHTPGQIGLLIESEGERLIQLADLLHTPMQFAHPEWSPSFDADPVLSATTRRSTLRRAADQNLLVLFYHLPFPGVGWVGVTGQEFVWKPVEG
jgi:glyoxylase-like metal-dependent hydrolase (beta-lactamase superfamily II)